MFGAALVSGCGSANASECDDLLVKKIEADTLAITAMGDRVAELSKANPSQEKLDDLELEIIGLESLSDGAAEEMARLGC